MKPRSTIEMLFIVILVILVTLLGLEKLAHERRLRSIRIRVHVNGTRGKTSVTRLIATALRQAGIRTLAKTSGNEPIIIYPDGREEVIHRRGPARIQEQLKFIKSAAKVGVEAIVVECMAIKPHLQLVSETRIVKSTIGVITNVRCDHMELMGESLQEIAESLSQTIPTEGILVTAEGNYAEIFRLKAAKKNTKLYLAEIRPDIELNGYSALLFPDNAAIVEKVCSLLGVAGSNISEALTDTTNNQAAPRVIKVLISNKVIHFIDALSANDVESTTIIQDMTSRTYYCPRPFVALLNNRLDRPLRMRSFVSFLCNEPLYDYVFLIGESQRLAKRYFRRHERTEKIIALRNQDPQQLIEEICRIVPYPEFTLLGMGNHRGVGDLLSHFLHGKGDTDAN